MLLLAGATLLPSSSKADYWATVQPSSTWGTWDGWGCSLAWWANAFGTNEMMAEVLFSTNYTTFTYTYPVTNSTSLPDLGFNIVRYNLGAQSWNAIGTNQMYVTANLTNLPYRQIAGYWTNWYSTNISSSSWTWWVDSNQRNAMWNARNLGANIFELISYSPMWWMCYNLDPEGSTNGSSDNLEWWNYDYHAVYIASVASYAHLNWGINFNYVEAFNEPTADWWTWNCGQEGCHYDNGTMASVIGNLRTELNNRGLSGVNITASDEYSFTQASNTWQSFSSTTRSNIAKINVHGYDMTNTAAKSNLYSVAAGTRIWQSEYNDNDTSGMTLAETINNDMANLHPTGWCYWQPYDYSSVGLIEANLSQGILGLAWPKYYVMAQYSRHIKQGMTIITSGDHNTTAAYDSTNHKLILVTQNWGTAQYIGYDLTQFTTANGNLTRWETDTDGTGDLHTQHNDLTWNQTKQFWVWFPTNCIMTIEADNVIK